MFRKGVVRLLLEQILLDSCQLIGGLILTFSSIPQIKLILRTKSAKDFSLTSYLLTDLGILLMEIYAIGLAMKGVGLAFLITNTLSLACVFIMTYLIIKYGGKKDGLL
jgi:MtN3 and saliva related transmembrane protein